MGGGVENTNKYVWRQTGRKLKEFTFVVLFLSEVECQELIYLKQTIFVRIDMKAFLK